MLFQMSNLKEINFLEFNSRAFSFKEDFITLLISIPS